MQRQPGGRRRSELGSVRSVVLALVIASAGVLAVGGAYAVVTSVPPLPATDTVVPAAAVVAPAPVAAPAPVVVPAVAVPAAPAQAVLPAKTPGVPRVVVIGDAFTTGAAGSSGRSTWPAILGRRLGCEAPAGFAAPGTGWSRPGNDGLAVGGRLDGVVAAQPDVVVIAVGAADLGVPLPVIRGSVNQMLFKLDRQLPGVPVVVLSPFSPTAPAPYPLIDIRGWVYDAAVKHGATFVNVTDLFDADHAYLVRSDGLAPRPDGQSYIADTVQPFLQAALGY